MNYSSTAKIGQLPLLNLLLGNVGRETTIPEYWGYLCLSAEGERERVTRKNMMVVLGEVSQSTVQILAGFEIFLLLGCLPFLSCRCNITLPAFSCLYPVLVQFQNAIK